MELNRFDIRNGGPWRKILVLLLLILAPFALGYYLSSQKETVLHDSSGQGTQEKINTSAGSSQPSASQRQEPIIWTCSMHPQIKLPKPGKCPICYMDLVPLDSAGHDQSSSTFQRFSMSEQAKVLAEVNTTEVRREKAKIEVRMLGMVVEDETRVAALTSRVDGRLDKIYVNFTGVQVSKGDPMVTIWSPTLIKNQVELFEAIRSGEPEESVIKGAEEKLVQSGLTREQIEEIREKKKPILYVTLKAPISGTVMKKLAILGQFVKEGTEMYIINDLSHVWIKLDAYETDIPWIRYGQDVTFTTPSLPGHKFAGKVLFIDPTLDTKTRSVKVRVEAANPDNSLRPGMFVTAVLESEIDHSGKVVKSEWAGRFICPVHPRDEGSPTPGTCPDSNMELRPASSYGYADVANPVAPIVIPSSAPLITGRRAVVYVEVPESDRPTYEARDVVLGPRAGDKYVVYQGLKEGERVVTKGSFKIDSAMQILARHSMMSLPEPRKAQKAREKSEDLVKRLQAPTEFVESLTPLVGEYLKLKDTLVEEDGPVIEKSAARFLELMGEVHSAKLEGPSFAAWNKLSQEISKNLNYIIQAKEIQARRKAFDPLSEAFVKVLMSFRHTGKHDLIVFYCSMAFDQQGAYWIEADENRRNPYFGRKPFKGQDMLTCGELVERIPPDAVTSTPKLDNSSLQDDPTSTTSDNHSEHMEGGK